MANPGLGVLPKLRTGHSRLFAFYPSKVSQGLNSVVRVKAVWSTDNRQNIINLPRRLTSLSAFETLDAYTQRESPTMYDRHPL